MSVGKGMAWSRAEHEVRAFIGAGEEAGILEREDAIADGSDRSGLDQFAQLVQVVAAHGGDPGAERLRDEQRIPCGGLGNARSGLGSELAEPLDQGDT